ncbi:Cytochrome P450 [Sphingobium faniae]|nr:Cytochrome P450 [Sphingobium faniae]
MVSVPSVSLDLFSDAALIDPYDNYRALRDLGPLAYLENLGMYVASRHRDIKEILSRPDIFISGRGVMLNAVANDAYSGRVGLCSDGDAHRRTRSLEARPLTPSALRELRATIKAEADAVAETICREGRFDAVTRLAQHLPVTIVSSLVGLPEDGRERMLDWAAANFDAFGPLNDRTMAALALCEEMQNYAVTQCVPGKLKPGSWAAKLHEAADRGEIEEMEARFLALTYVGPSLDTTINATSSAIWLFAQNPRQWDALRERPAAIPNAINEAIRLETPLQAISRYALGDFELDGTRVPAHSRIILLYGSANRDERHWSRPETFDINRRNANEHLAFGHGRHQCIGNNLARMEIAALLAALAKRVRRFELHGHERALNNTLRGFKRLDVTVH